MPSLLATVLSSAADDLRIADARFAVVGGVAVGVRTKLRYTRDADLAVAVGNDAHAERIVTVLLRYGYRPVAELDHRAGRFATLRMLSPRVPSTMDPTDAPLLDLIFSSSGIEPEVVATADLIEVMPGIVLPTARVPHLIAMKLVSESKRRLQDRIDIQSLLAAATESDLKAVHSLIDLITRRGFNRGKNLAQSFARFQRLFGASGGL